MPSAHVARAVGLHYQLQLGTYYDSVHHVPDAIIAVGGVPGCIWNHVAVLPGADPPTGEWIDRGVGWLRELSRPPAVYVEREMASSVGRLLEERSLSHVDTEAWMFHAGDGVRTNTSSTKYSLHAVDSPERTASLHRLISECFDKEHSEAMRRESTPVGGRRTGQHFVFEEGSVAVGAASMFYADGWAELHDICIAPSMRGRDLGIHLVARLVDVATRVAGAELFLQCDGGPLEAFYRRSGFETRYVRLGYATEKPT